MKSIVITNAYGVRCLRCSGEAGAKVINNKAIVPATANETDIRRSPPTRENTSAS